MGFFPTLLQSVLRPWPLTIPTHTFNGGPLISHLKAWAMMVLTFLLSPEAGRDIRKVVTGLEAHFPPKAYPSGRDTITPCIGTAHSSRPSRRLYISSTATFGTGRHKFSICCPVSHITHILTKMSLDIYQMFRDRNGSTGRMTVPR